MPSYVRLKAALAAYRRALKRHSRAQWDDPAATQDEEGIIDAKCDVDDDPIEGPVDDVLDTSSDVDSEVDDSIASNLRDRRGKPHAEENPQEAPLAERLRH